MITSRTSLVRSARRRLSSTSTQKTATMEHRSGLLYRARVAKDKPNPGQYGDVVGRLQQIVEALEQGELSLEESLERFGEGVLLVKQGEKLLSDAEKRIEQLLGEDGRTAPLKVPESAAETPSPAVSQASLATPMASRAVPRKPAPPPEEDDVPF